MQPSLRTPSHTLTRCLVCGSSEVRTDEVIDRGIVFLAECPRCEHRWTRSAAHASLRPVSARRGDAAAAEVATAA